MGIEYGVGKKTGGNDFALTDNYQSISISVAAAGTTDAGLKFGGSFGISTADELVFNPYTVNAATTEDGAYDPNGNKAPFKLVNKSADVDLRGVGYNVSGGAEITQGQMVSVKINSAWYEAGSTVSTYNGTFESIARTSAVCKLAGEIVESAAISLDRDGDADDNGITEGEIGGGGAGYARAGLVVAGGATFTGTTAADGGAIRHNGPTVYVDNSAIIASKVYHGPFMEVMMTSSTTKMVVGGVCVTHDAKQSKTKIHMDVASRVMHVSDAAIYIEGGFGKLSVSTSAYGGSVGGIGAAGDEVEVGGDLVATLSSVSFMGLNGHGAVALDTVSLGGRPNYSFGTSIDLLGLTFAVEMEDEQGGDPNTYIDVWDAATSYDFNGMAVGIATDSDNDWAMSLGYELMGFSMSTVVQNVAPNLGKKAGLSIDTSFSTSLNGVGISVSLDEDLAMTLGASYSMGNSGLTMYVNYSQADNGGKIGATMSF
jgi:hypothetical protein